MPDDDIRTVLVTQDGGVTTMTFNRPELRNAMTLEMVEELSQSLAHAEADGKTRVVVLQGAGGNFCAGGDLKGMSTLGGGEEARADIVAMSRAFGALCVQFDQTPLATIVALQGAVMGGGFGLACVADVAVADKSVNFRLPETSLGLVPAQIAPFLVQRLGYAQARRLAVSGGALDASQALSIGLVHQVAADAVALQAAVNASIADILACAPNAVAATKALVARASRKAPADLIDDAANIFADALLGTEGQEGTRAFVEKRRPAWASEISSNAATRPRRA